MLFHCRSARIKVLKLGVSGKSMIELNFPPGKIKVFILTPNKISDWGLKTPLSPSPTFDYYV